MNTNLSTSITLSILAFTICLICSCDKKKSEINCDPNTPPPTPIMFELTDKEGRDLLNPATPGYYDSTQVADANGLHQVVAFIVPPQPLASNPGKYMMAVFEGAEKNTIFYLSENDADTIRTDKVLVNPKPCSGYTVITALYYNNVAAERIPFKEAYNFIAVKR